MLRVGYAVKLCAADVVHGVTALLEVSQDPGSEDDCPQNRFWCALRLLPPGIHLQESTPVLAHSAVRSDTLSAGADAVLFVEAWDARIHVFLSPIAHDMRC